MKRTILTLLAASAVAVSASAQRIVEYGNVSPLRYEQRDGMLQIRSWARLDSPAGKKTSVSLNGGGIRLETNASKDTLYFWMPLVGAENKLAVSNGGKSVSDYVIPSPVSSDWGYFAGGTIHIIQSSHQDIAWMDTPEYCRTERINDIIMPALEIMRENPEFTFEMEQTLNLMEFLEAHPEMKDEVIQRYREGRFYWGATYNQPYEGLSSGEQLVRQAYFGRKWIMDNLGCDDRTANNIDVPGRTMQMPQILAKSGIENLFVSRMGEGLYDWYSPDGSSVLTFTPGNYGWATLMWKFFDNGAVEAMDKLHTRLSLWDDYFKTRNIPPHYAVLISCDATKPVDFTPVIKEWNEIAAKSGGKLPKLVNSTAETWFNIVKQGTPDFEKIYGERPDLWLYIHGPAHYQQTLAKREAAVSLPAAETFSVIAEGMDNGYRYPKEQLDRGWMASIYPDHGLGGKNGEITDSIFTDSLKTAQRIGAELLGGAIDHIAGGISVKGDAVTVFNDLTWERDGLVYIPAGDSPIAVFGEDGKEIPVQKVSRGGDDYYVFIAEGVPSVGYKSFRYKNVRKAKYQGAPAGVKTGGNYYENGFYRILFGDGGIESLVDKELGKNLVQNEKFAFGDVIEVGYKGNGAGEFNRIADPVAGDITSLRNTRTDWKLVTDGAVCAVYESIKETANADIRQTITIYHNIKQIDFDIALIDFNGEHNRQYRLAFPLDMMNEASTIDYEVPMGILTVGEDEMKTIPRGWSWEGTYVHHPEDSHPREIQNFMSASGNGIGFTMSSCVAVGDWIDPSREQADYTVMQGILLSSHKSCHGEGNWYHQTGTHEYHFSVTSHPEGWKNGYRFGVEANRPLAARIVKGGNGGVLPAGHSFMAVSDPFVSVNAFKKSDDGRGVILRITEMEGKDKNVTVTLPFNAAKVIRCSLIEEEQEVLDVSGKEITLPIGHHSIDTYKIIVE